MQQYPGSSLSKAAVIRKSEPLATSDLPGSPVQEELDDLSSTSSEKSTSTVKHHKVKGKKRDHSKVKQKGDPLNTKTVSEDVGAPSGLLQPVSSISSASSTTAATSTTSSSTATTSTSIAPALATITPTPAASSTVVAPTMSVVSSAAASVQSAPAVSKLASVGSSTSNTSAISSVASATSKSTAPAPATATVTPAASSTTPSSTSAAASSSGGSSSTGETAVVYSAKAINELLGLVSEHFANIETVVKDMLQQGILQQITPRPVLAGNKEQLRTRIQALINGEELTNLIKKGRVLEGNPCIKGSKLQKAVKSFTDEASHAGFFLLCLLSSPKIDREFLLAAWFSFLLSRAALQKIEKEVGATAAPAVSGLATGIAITSTSAPVSSGGGSSSSGEMEVSTKDKNELLELAKKYFTNIEPVVNGLFQQLIPVASVGEKAQLQTRIRNLLQDQESIIDRAEILANSPYLKGKDGKEFIAEIRKVIGRLEEVSSNELDIINEYFYVSCWGHLQSARDSLRKMKTATNVTTSPAASSTVLTATTSTSISPAPTTATVTPAVSSAVSVTTRSTGSTVPPVALAQVVSAASTAVSARSTTATTSATSSATSATSTSTASAPITATVKPAISSTTPSSTSAPASSSGGSSSVGKAAVVKPVKYEKELVELAKQCFIKIGRLPGVIRQKIGEIRTQSLQDPQVLVNQLSKMIQSFFLDEDVSRFTTTIVSKPYTYTEGAYGKDDLNKYDLNKNDFDGVVQRLSLDRNDIVYQIFLDGIVSVIFCIETFQLTVSKPSEIDELLNRLDKWHLIASFALQNINQVENVTATPTVSSTALTATTSTSTAPVTATSTARPAASSAAVTITTSVAPAQVGSAVLTPTSASSTTAATSTTSSSTATTSTSTAPALATITPTPAVSSTVVATTMSVASSSAASVQSAPAVSKLASAGSSTSNTSAISSVASATSKSTAPAPATATVTPAASSTTPSSTSAHASSGGGSSSTREMTAVKPAVYSPNDNNELLKLANKHFATIETVVEKMLYQGISQQIVRGPVSSEGREQLQRRILVLLRGAEFSRFMDSMKMLAGNPCCTKIMPSETDQEFIDRIIDIYEFLWQINWQKAVSHIDKKTLLHIWQLCLVTKEARDASTPAASSTAIGIARASSASASFGGGSSFSGKAEVQSAVNNAIENNKFLGLVNQYFPQAKTLNSFLELVKEYFSEIQILEIKIPGITIPQMKTVNDLLELTKNYFAQIETVIKDIFQQLIPVASAEEKVRLQIVIQDLLGGAEFREFIDRVEILANSPYLKGKDGKRFIDEIRKVIELIRNVSSKRLDINTTGFYVSCWKNLQFAREFLQKMNKATNVTISPAASSTVLTATTSTSISPAPTTATVTPAVSSAVSVTTRSTGSTVPPVALAQVVSAASTAVSARSTTATTSATSSATSATFKSTAPVAETVMPIVSRTALTATPAASSTVTATTTSVASSAAAPVQSEPAVSTPAFASSITATSNATASSNSEISLRGGFSPSVATEVIESGKDRENENILFLTELKFPDLQGYIESILGKLEEILSNKEKDYFVLRKELQKILERLFTNTDLMAALETIKRFEPETLKGIERRFIEGVKEVIVFLHPDVERLVGNYASLKYCFVNAQKCREKILQAKSVSTTPVSSFATPISKSAASAPTTAPATPAASSAVVATTTAAGLAVPPVAPAQVGSAVSTPAAASSITATSRFPSSATLITSTSRASVTETLTPIISRTALTAIMSTSTVPAPATATVTPTTSSTAVVTTISARSAVPPAAPVQSAPSVSTPAAASSTISTSFHGGAASSSSTLSRDDLLKLIKRCFETIEPAVRNILNEVEKIVAAVAGKDVLFEQVSQELVRLLEVRKEEIKELAETRGLLSTDEELTRGVGVVISSLQSGLKYLIDNYYCIQGWFRFVQKTLQKINKEASVAITPVSSSAFARSTSTSAASVIVAAPIVVSPISFSRSMSSPVSHVSGSVTPSVPPPPAVPYLPGSEIPIALPSAMLASAQKGSIASFPKSSVSSTTSITGWSLRNPPGFPPPPPLATLAPPPRATLSSASSTSSVSSATMTTTSSSASSRGGSSSISATTVVVELEKHGNTLPVLITEHFPALRLRVHAIINQLKTASTQPKEFLNSILQPSLDGLFKDPDLRTTIIALDALKLPDPKVLLGEDVQLRLIAGMKTIIIFLQQEGEDLVQNYRDLETYLTGVDECMNAIYEAELRTHTTPVDSRASSATRPYGGGSGSAAFFPPSSNTRPSTSPYVGGGSSSVFPTPVYNLISPRLAAEHLRESLKTGGFQS